MKKRICAIILAIVSFNVASTEMQQEGSWYYKKQENKMTDKTDIFASTSTKDVYTRQGLERYVSLVVRCKENKTDAYISLYDYLGSGQPQITIRFDDGKPVKSRWTSAEGGDAAFAPNAVSFIKDLAKHKKVIIGFEPYGSTMQAVEFDLTGSDKMAVQIAEACGWKI